MDLIDGSAGNAWKIMEIFGWVGRDDLEIHGIRMTFSKQKTPNFDVFRLMEA